MKGCRVANNLIRPGDLVIWQRSGLLANVLSWIIHLLKEPEWDRWGWHMTPMVSATEFVDAQFPKVKISSLTDSNYVNRKFRVYKVSSAEPSPDKLLSFCKEHVGKKYDWKVYILTGVAKLLRPFIDIPRLVDRNYDCWEVSFNFLEIVDFEPVINSGYDYNYPWICDFLRCVGEMKTK